MANKVTLYFTWINEMRHSKFFAPFLFTIIKVDAHDHIGPNHTKALNDIQSDAAKAKHHCIASKLCLGGVDHGTNSSGHAATDIADFVKRRCLVDLGQSDFRQHRKI